jgi:hypothetical protein
MTFLYTRRCFTIFNYDFCRQLMTIYFIGAFVVLIVWVYLYAKKEGRKDIALDHLREGVERANKVNESDQAIDAKAKRAIDRVKSRRGPLDFWMSGKDSSKKP